MSRKRSEIPYSHVVGSGTVRSARGQFDEAFKRTVVAQVERLGRSQSSVARSYE